MLPSGALWLLEALYVTRSKHAFLSVQRLVSAHRHSFVSRIPLSKKMSITLEITTFSNGRITFEKAEAALKVLGDSEDSRVLVSTLKSTSLVS